MGSRSDPFDCCVVNAILPYFARGQKNYTAPPLARFKQNQECPASPMMNHQTGQGRGVGGCSDPFDCCVVVV